MKKSLTNPPLVHVVLELKFAEIPSLRNISEELESNLHNRMMEIGFPEILRSRVEGFDVKIDPLTQSMIQNRYDNKRLLFRAAGEQSIVEISSSSIQLKATKYTSFESFYESFSKALEAICDLTQLSKAVLKFLELRYVNVIVPSNNHTLSEFIAPGYSAPNFFDKFKNLQGQRINVFETNAGQLIINFAEIRTMNNRVHHILPNDLMEPDQNCILSIEGQESWLNVSAETYGLLDMRHVHQFKGSPILSIDEIDRVAKELYTDISEVFWEFITPLASEKWGKYEV